MHLLNYCYHYVYFMFSEPELSEYESAADESRDIEVSSDGSV